MYKQLYGLPLFEAGLMTKITRLDLHQQIEVFPPVRIFYLLHLPSSLASARTNNLQNSFVLIYN
jgi:hypothetical protein